MNEFKLVFTQDDLSLIGNGLANVQIAFKDAGKVQELINKINKQIQDQLPHEEPKE